LRPVDLLAVDEKRQDAAWRNVERGDRPDQAALFVDQRIASITRALQIAENRHSLATTPRQSGLWIVRRQHAVLDAGAAICDRRIHPVRSFHRIKIGIDNRDQLFARQMGRFDALEERIRIYKAMNRKSIRVALAGDHRFDFGNEPVARDLDPQTIDARCGPFPKRHVAAKPGQWSHRQIPGDKVCTRCLAKIDWQCRRRSRSQSREPRRHDCAQVLIAGLRRSKPIKGCDQRSTINHRHEPTQTFPKPLKLRTVVICRNLTSQVRGLR